MHRQGEIGAACAALISGLRQDMAAYRRQNARLFLETHQLMSELHQEVIEALDTLAVRLGRQGQPGSNQAAVTGVATGADDGTPDS